MTLPLVGGLFGHLNGAGPGARLHGYYPRIRDSPDLKLVLRAALIIGSVGALVG